MVLEITERRGANLIFVLARAVQVFATVVGQRLHWGEKKVGDRGGGGEYYLSPRVIWILARFVEVWQRGGGGSKYRCGATNHDGVRDRGCPAIVRECEDRPGALVIACSAKPRRAQSRLMRLLGVFRVAEEEIGRWGLGHGGPFLNQSAILPTKTPLGGGEVANAAPRARWCRKRRAV